MTPEIHHFEARIHAQVAISSGVRPDFTFGFIYHIDHFMLHEDFRNRDERPRATGVTQADSRPLSA